MSSKAAIPKSLKQKMAASVSGAGQSLVPDIPGVTSSPTPPPAEVDLIPSIDQLIGDAEDLTTLRDLVNLQVKVNAQKKELEKKLEPINDRIKAIVSEYGIEKAVCDGANITLSQGSRSTINKLKLVAYGVDEEIITACTDVTTTQTLKITPAKL
jgi:hypothetical protein